MNRWINAKKDPPQDGMYLVIVSLWGKKLPEEVHREVYSFNKAFGWRGEYDYVQGKVIAYRPLPPIDGFLNRRYVQKMDKEPA